MKTVNLGGFKTSNSKEITSVIGKKLRDNEKKSNSKIDLGKLAEKLAERKEKITSEENEEKN